MQTSMVYYNPAAMYRHQQTAPSGQFHAGSPMHSWYAANYHHQGGQMPTAAATPSYCMQEEPQLWHHNAATSHPAHGVFHQDFPQDFGGGSGGGGGGGMPLQPQNGPMMEHATTDGRLQSTPPSGSELSSPGPQGGSGNISPQATQTRPQQVRSPYDWIKKTSYQTLPNPESRSPNHPDIEPAICGLNGKTRTKDKYRVVYTDHQRIELEKEFMFNNKYITIRRKSELASNLGLSERQIKIWFQNRRAKERKQAKKRIEEKSQIEQLHQVHQQNNPHHHHHHHHGLYVSNHHQVMATNNLKEEAVKVEDVWQKAVI